LNMIISFYYYLRIVKAIFMDQNEEPIKPLSVPLLPRLSLYTCIVGVLAAGFIGWIYQHIYQLAGTL
ncbi:MAG TPA: NADH-quinone oxidoreductase subunit N, partial [Flavisolibacter sp.]|nr:NADH-quinone oxidoreductase subunit N [Flavisolibacter sp.]